MCDHSAKVIAEALSNCVDVNTPSALPQGEEPGMDMKGMDMKPFP